MKEGTVQIDQSGRLVLPKKIRERLHLKTGDKLAVGVKGDAIELRPTRKTLSLERVNGVLVLTGETFLPQQNFTSVARDGRMNDVERVIKGGR